MSEAKHTPVPWHIDAGPRHYSIYNQRGRVIADMRLHNNRVPIKETEANAHLIAAAPELFHIVQRLVAYNAHYSVATFAEWDEMIRDAKAVLAKAEGVQTEVAKA